MVVFVSLFWCKFISDSAKIDLKPKKTERNSFIICLNDY